MSFSLVVLLSYWFPPSCMHFPLLYKLETLCLEVGKPLGTCFYSPQLSVGIRDINAGGSQCQACWHLCTSECINVDLRALERSREFALSTPATVRTCRGALWFNLQERATCPFVDLSWLLPYRGESRDSRCVLRWMCWAFSCWQSPQSSSIHCRWLHFTPGLCLSLCSSLLKQALLSLFSILVSICLFI